MTTIKPPLPTNTLESARRLRRNLTDAERNHLRGSQLNELKFRRQHPVPPYIADFCCIEKMLIVELDGGQHSQEADAHRTGHLQSCGWRVLRFWDHDVLLNMDSVLEAIWNAAAGPNPHPNPSPAGRGALESERN